jgi:hypothetical protein
MYDVVEIGWNYFVQFDVALAHWGSTVASHIGTSGLGLILLPFVAPIRERREY